MKPCPFCRKEMDANDPDTLYPNASYWQEDENGITHYVGNKDRKEDYHQCWNIVCSQSAGGCGAEISGDTKEEVLAKWNNRVT